MAFYHKLGKLPPVKHTAFYKPDGIAIYKEELVSTKGFSGIYSNKYHINAPTQTIEINDFDFSDRKELNKVPLRHIHFMTDKLGKPGNFLTSRICYLENKHCRISTARPTENPEIFFKNSFHNEYIFIHRGSGVLKSDYGNLPFEQGDQIIVPMGTIYQMFFDSLEDNKLLIVESDTAYEIPRHYKNEYGQCEEHAPYCERDFKVPSSIEPLEQKGRFSVIHKAGEHCYEYVVPNHPFDVVGWDGYLYPFSINIRNFHPKVGRIHLPPPVHLLMNTKHFVVCNFNPRPFDWYPGAIPAPYFHTNVDSAEVLYYAEGDFMSRKGVSIGSVTLHPLGIPHGPQPGKTEASIGKTHTEEYAVMVDTFEQLHPTDNVAECEDPHYFRSWLEE